jgi:uncharacterized protein (DUF58 family)
MHHALGIPMSSGFEVPRRAPTTARARRGGPSWTSRLQLRVHPGGLVALAGLVIGARIPSLSPGAGPGFGLLAALAVALLLDMTWSLVSLRRRGLAATARAPSDAIVGEPAPVTVSVGGRRAPLLLRMSSARDAPWLRLDAPGELEVVTVPERRGSFGAVEVGLLHSAPFGLVGAVRTVSVGLATPILVGPRPVVPEGVSFPPAPHEADSDVVPARVDEGELLRGVRPYVPGDTLRRVHWPLTARTGEVVVRELDAVRRPAVVVVVDLGPEPGSRAEAVAGLASGVAGEALRTGHPVELITREAAGRRAAPVHHPADVARRLAVAEPGEPPQLAGVVDDGSALLVVDPHGWRWRVAR